MEKVLLTNRDENGNTLEAVFLPGLGMNLISYTCGDVQAIDQSTKNLFDERFAGLGALIGPHFHHRKYPALVKDESLFPHIQRVREKGIKEPFSHGIARYAPWKVEHTENRITAVLTGKDTWNGVPLSELEGQNFTMRYAAELEPGGLRIKLSIVSDTDSLVGIHYYYRLPNGKGRVASRVQKKYRDAEGEKELSHHQLDASHVMHWELGGDAIDHTYYPYPDPLHGEIELETETYKLITKYGCVAQENCWQLYHPKDASFVCIEPMSAQDPRHPNLTVSGLDIHLQILPK